MTNSTQQTLNDSMLTVIPFAGFYESVFSELAEESLRSAKNFFEKLSEDELGELESLTYEVQDFGEVHLDIAKAYATGFSEYFGEETGFDLALQFESMQSPREYNFATDRIFCFIQPKIVEALYRVTDKEILNSVIGERFTSRSGFISAYANTLEQWITDKRANAWDHNQIETLIIAKLKQHEISENLLLSCESPLYWGLSDKQGNGHFDCLSSQYTLKGADTESVERFYALLEKEYA